MEVRRKFLRKLGLRGVGVWLRRRRREGLSISGCAVCGKCGKGFDFKGKGFCYFDGDRMLLVCEDCLKAVKERLKGEGYEVWVMWME